jgi:hypothetical protein
MGMKPTGNVKWIEEPAGPRLPGPVWSIIILLIIVGAIAYWFFS